MPSTPSKPVDYLDDEVSLAVKQSKKMKKLTLEATPMDCLGMTRPLARVTWSVNSVPILSSREIGSFE